MEMIKVFNPLIFKLGLFRPLQAASATTHPTRQYLFFAIEMSPSLLQIHWLLHQSLHSRDSMIAFTVVTLSVRAKDDRWHFSRVFLFLGFAASSCLDRGIQFKFGDYNSILDRAWADSEIAPGSHVLELIGSFVAPETGAYTFHPWTKTYAASGGYTPKTILSLDGVGRWSASGDWSVSSIELTKDFRYAIQENTEASFYYCRISLGFNSPNYGEDCVTKIRLR
jgi:hypothetical protein